MHRVDLSESVIAIERKLIARADVALKGGAPASGLRVPDRIRKFLPLEIAAS